MHLSFAARLETSESAKFVIGPLRARSPVSCRVAELAQSLLEEISRIENRSFQATAGMSSHELIVSLSSMKGRRDSCGMGQTSIAIPIIIVFVISFQNT